MNENIKYLILDYGKVLAGPSTSHWFITPKFYEIINEEEIDMDKFNNAINKVSHIIGQEMKNEDDEYNAFFDVYSNILKDINYKGNIKEAAQKIAYDFVYNDEKHILYSEVKENLERLSKKYKLILLSDNWPCAIRIMKNWGIYKFFESIYISSIYKTQKKEKKLFDYPIKDFNIEKNEAIFVDDNMELLDIASSKGLISILMDRDNIAEECHYKVIKSLIEL